MISQNLDFKDFWWDTDGHLHVIDSENVEFIFTNARIVERKINCEDSKSIIVEQLAFKGEIVYEQS